MSSRLEGVRDLADRCCEYEPSWTLQPSLVKIREVPSRNWRIRTRNWGVIQYLSVYLDNLNFVQWKQPVIQAVMMIGWLGRGSKGQSKHISGYVTRYSHMRNKYGVFVEQWSLAVAGRLNSPYNFCA
jgi:hypothetical protein